MTGTGGTRARRCGRPDRHVREHHGLGRTRRHVHGAEYNSVGEGPRSAAVPARPSDHHADPHGTRPPRHRGDRASIRSSGDRQVGSTGSGLYADTTVRVTVTARPRPSPASGRTRRHVQRGGVNSVGEGRAARPHGHDQRPHPPAVSPHALILNARQFANGSVPADGRRRRVDISPRVPRSEVVKSAHPGSSCARTPMPGRRDRSAFIPRYGQAAGGRRCSSRSVARTARGAAPRPPGTDSSARSRHNRPVRLDGLDIDSRALASLNTGDTESATRRRRNRPSYPRSAESSSVRIVLVLRLRGDVLRQRLQYRIRQGAAGSERGSSSRIHACATTSRAHVHDYNRGRSGAGHSTTRWARDFHIAMTDICWRVPVAGNTPTVPAGAEDQVAFARRGVSAETLVAPAAYSRRHDSAGYELRGSTAQGRPRLRGS